MFVQIILQNSVKYKEKTTIQVYLQVVESKEPTKGYRILRGHAIKKLLHFTLILL